MCDYYSQFHTSLSQQLWVRHTSFLTQLRIFPSIQTSKQTDSLAFFIKVKLWQWIPPTLCINSVPKRSSKKGKETRNKKYIPWGEHYFKLGKRTLYLAVLMQKPWVWYQGKKFMQNQGKASITTFQIPVYPWVESCSSRSWNLSTSCKGYWNKLHIR